MNLLIETPPTSVCMLVWLYSATPFRLSDKSGAETTDLPNARYDARLRFHHVNFPRCRSADFVSKVHPTKLRSDETHCQYKQVHRWIESVVKTARFWARETQTKRGVCVCVCVCVCVRAYVCMHAYTHTHTLSLSSAHIHEFDLCFQGSLLRWIGRQGFCNIEGPFVIERWNCVFQTIPAGKHPSRVARVSVRASLGRHDSEIALTIFVFSFSPHTHAQPC